MCSPLIFIALILSPKQNFLCYFCPQKRFICAKFPPFKGLGPHPPGIIKTPAFRHSKKGSECLRNALEMFRSFGNFRQITEIAEDNSVQYFVDELFALGYYSQWRRSVFFKKFFGRKSFQQISNV